MFPVIFTPTFKQKLCLLISLDHVSVNDNNDMKPVLNHDQSDIILYQTIQISDVACASDYFYSTAKPSPAPNRQSQPLLNGTLTFRTNKQSQVSIGKLTAGTQTLTCNLKTSELNCTLETGLQTIIVTDYTLNLNPTDYIFEVTCTQNNLLDLPTIKATVKDSQNSETSITHTLKAKPRS